MQAPTFPWEQPPADSRDGAGNVQPIGSWDVAKSSGLLTAGSAHKQVSITANKGSKSLFSLILFAIINLVLLGTLHINDCKMIIN
jgi:hypothetical protein